MNKLILRLTVCIVWLIVSGAALAQSPAKIERELVSHQENIEKWINESAAVSGNAKESIRLKDKAVSEDEAKRLSNQIDDMMNKQKASVEQMAAAKEAEVMKV